MTRTFYPFSRSPKKTNLNFFRKNSTTSLLDNENENKNKNEDKNEKKIENIVFVENDMKIGNKTKSFRKSDPIIGNNLENMIISPNKINTQNTLNNQENQEIIQEESNKINEKLIIETRLEVDTEIDLEIEKNKIDRDYMQKNNEKIPNESKIKLLNYKKYDTPVLDIYGRNKTENILFPTDYSSAPNSPDRGPVDSRVRAFSFKFLMEFSFLAIKGFIPRRESSFVTERSFRTVTFLSNKFSFSFSFSLSVSIDKM